MRRGGMGGLSRGYAGLVSAAAVGRAGNAAGLSWLPAPGTVADLGTDTLDTAAGRTTGFWRSYSGIGWAPWWGSYGSVIAGGGGHTNGEYNDLYRFNLDTQDWTRIKTAATSYVKPATSLNADTATGWMWANATNGDTALQTGELHSDHHYANLLCVPGDAISGTAPNGWLVKAGTVAMSTLGGAGTTRCAVLAMGEDETWAHLGSGDTVGSSRGGTAYDSLRGRIWCRPDSRGRTLYYKQCSGGAEGSVLFSGSSWENGGSVLEYSAADDLLIRYKHGGDSDGVTLRVLDPADATQYTPTISGTAPSSGYFACCWSESWGCLVVYEGGGGNTVYFLKPSGDPRSTTWTWSTQTFTGTARGLYEDVSGEGQSYNRIRHVESLGNVLVWCARGDQPVQLIHLSAAP